MDPEFKAYVEMVKGANGSRRASAGWESADAAQSVVAATKSFFTRIADMLEGLPPYYCELRMLPRANSDRCSSRNSSHKDAIGYHGLV